MPATAIIAAGPWPAGASVALYDRKSSQPVLDMPSPPGSAFRDGPSTVAGDGSVTFVNVPYSSKLWAIGQDDQGRWRWVAITSPDPLPALASGQSQILGIRDRLDQVPITIGQIISEQGRLYQRKTADGTIDKTKFANPRYTALNWPHLPRNHAAMAYGRRQGGAAVGKGLRYKRPARTGSSTVVLNISAGDTAVRKFRYDWDTDVIVRLPGIAWPNDLQVFDARTVTVIGGAVTATGAAVGLGGAFGIRGIRDWIWHEGLVLDLRDRTAGGGVPQQHDAFNCCGKARQGSDGGHRVGDPTAAFKDGGLDILDYTGTSIPSKYRADPDWTRYSYPDLYIQNCLVLGVQGQESIVGPETAHGDVVQFQGPIGGVYIHNLTASTQYQGFQFQSAQGVLGPIVMSNINLKGYDPVSDTDGDSSFLIWLPGGAAGVELPQVIMDNVVCGPSSDGAGGYKPLSALVNPSPSFSTTSGAREDLDVGFRDMGYLAMPVNPLRLTAIAATGVFTTYRWAADGLTATPTAHGMSDGEAIVLSATGSNESGTLVKGFIIEQKVYYLRDTGASTFKLAASVGGPAVLPSSDITTETFFYFSKARKYIAPFIGMPWHGFIREGRPGDPDMVDPALVGVNYVPDFPQELDRGTPAVVNTVAASGAAVTLPGPAVAQAHDVTLTAANVVFAFAAPVAGGEFLLAARQDATGSRLATWPASVVWAGGVAPTLTTTAGKRDLFRFMSISGASWVGEIVAQNLA